MSEHSSSSAQAAGSPTTPPSDVSPAPTAAAPPAPLHPDVYLNTNGIRCIGKPKKKEKAVAPLVLYLDKVDLGGGKTLKGSALKDDEQHQLRFELQVESRSLRVGYVKMEVGDEIQRSKEMGTELQVAHQDLRSAKINIQRLTDRGGSSVEIILEAVDEGAAARTLTFTVDTRESSSFDSYTLERVKSAFKEWACRRHFPTAIDLTRALSVPSAGSAIGHLPPPESFNRNEPTTWFAPFVPRKEKEKQPEKGKKKRPRKPESDYEEDDDADWVDDSRRAAPARLARHDSPTDLEEGGVANGSPSSSRRAKQKSKPGSMRELSVEEQEEQDAIAMLLGPSRDAGDRDKDAYEPSPKKPKKLATAGKGKDTGPPGKGTKADLVKQLAHYTAQITSLSMRLDESDHKLARLEETAAKVPALEQAVAVLPALLERVGHLEAELAQLRPERAEAVAMEEP